MASAESGCGTTLLPLDATRSRMLLIDTRAKCWPRARHTLLFRQPGLPQALDKSRQVFSSLEHNPIFDI
jgi:hypothetical protein